MLAVTQSGCERTMLTVTIMMEMLVRNNGDDEGDDDEAMRNDGGDHVMVMS